MVALDGRNLVSRQSIALTYSIWKPAPSIISVLRRAIATVGATPCKHPTPLRSVHLPPCLSSRKFCPDNWKGCLAKISCSSASAKVTPRRASFGTRMRFHWIQIVNESKWKWWTQQRAAWKSKICKQTIRADTHARRPISRDVFPPLPDCKRWLITASMKWTTNWNNELIVTWYDWLFMHLPSTQLYSQM